MIGRDPSKGRHAIGSPIARSGIKAPRRTGRASGSVVGTGVNSKTGANPQYRGSQPPVGVDSKAEDFINQAPAPWDNSQPTSDPTKGVRAGPSAKVGGLGGKTGVTGPVRGRLGGSAGSGTQPTSNFPAAATGPSGGLGQEKGNVVGPRKPVKKGNVYNQPRGSSPGGYSGRGGAPSFYGR